MFDMLTCTSPRAVVAAAALLTLAGCAGVANLSEANRRSPGTIAAGSLTPGRPAAAQFGLDPTFKCPAGGPAAVVYVSVEAAAKAADAPLAVADGQLCALAEALLTWEDDVPLPGPVNAFLSQYFGLPMPAGSVLVKTIMTERDTEQGKANTEDPRQIGGALADTVNAYALKVPAPRYGLATMRLGKNRTKAVLVLQSGLVALDPLPRRLEPGQKAAVTGSLTGDLEDPTLLVSDSVGRLVTLKQPPGKAFKGEVSCERPGRLFVEVRAEEMGNERVLATLPIACGLPLPASVPVAAQTWPGDVAAQEKMMAALIDAERAAAGLPAITWSEPIGTIARALTEGMRDGVKGGVPAVPVNVAQRLIEADITATEILQNPAAMPTAEQAHERLMASPTHRANAMAPDVNFGGLGVAVGTDRTGRTTAYLTQLFVKVPPPPDPVAMRKAIVEVVARKRAGEKLGALVSDPGLEKLAAEYAAVIAKAGGPPPPATSKEFEKALQAGYRDIVLLRDARLDPNDYADDPNILSSKGKLFGVGAALGRHPRLGKNTLFVVLISANKIGKK